VLITLLCSTCLHKQMQKVMCCCSDRPLSDTRLTTPARIHEYVL
jgi:hypothetical protein